jgi:hypothetical protein
MFFSYDPSTHVLTVSASGAPRGNITRAQAYWVTGDTLAWKPRGSGSIQPDWDVTLYYDPDAGLLLNTEGVQGGTAIPLAWLRVGRVKGRQSVGSKGSKLVSALTALEESSGGLRSPAR